VTLIEIGGKASTRVAEHREIRVPHTRRRPRLIHAVPATRDLERSLRCALAGAAIATVVAAQTLAVAALVLAVAALALAFSLLRAIAVLSPPVLKPVRRRRGQPLRVAVIGAAKDAADLQAELVDNSVERVEVVGAITVAARSPNRPEPLSLGALHDVGRIVAQQSIDVLLMGGEERERVIESVLCSCEGDPVRLCDLCCFYEAVFGRLPLSHLDRVWLQCVLHPGYRERRAQRALDVFVSVVLLTLLLPVLGPIGLLIRRDGGPVFFRQERIGRDGRPFTLYKLRSMRWQGEEGPQRWSSASDPRVTRLGRFLRRSHLDELPQLLSVLRGDMTLVGPRPEQPQIAADIERRLPLWRGRYRYKPGLTGWAQIRCGYAGSCDGSAWKLAHDLFYLRHQSLALDVAILAQTARIVFIPPRHVEQGASPFVLRAADILEDDPTQAALAVPRSVV
jgi:lipopolysaccharide/colanic/teichoic acid biosynthesis glycosyltransferase